MNEYSELLEGVGISGVCVVVGRAIREIPQVPNWVIPFALPAVGALACCAMEGFNGPNVIKGTLAGGNAVWMNQALRQGKTGTQTMFLKKEKNADNHDA